MILQPLIASLNPESLSMPTGTLRNRDASFSSLFLPLPLPLSLYPSSPISLHPHQPSIRFVPFSSRSTLSLSLPFSFCPVETKNAHCGPDRWSLMSGIRFRPVEQSFVLIGNDATSLSRQPSPPLFTLLASAAIYIDVEPNRFAVQPANDRFLTDCSTLDFS